jgi:hypothetical protein
MYGALDCVQVLVIRTSMNIVTFLGEGCDVAQLRGIVSTHDISVAVLGRFVTAHSISECCVLVVWRQHQGSDSIWQFPGQSGPCMLALAGETFGELYRVSVPHI